MTEREKMVAGEVYLKGLLGHAADDEFIINQPFRCDYGSQISRGHRFYCC